MARISEYGPGDPETWGPCTGHPHDPRSDDDSDDDSDDAGEAEEEARDAKVRTPGPWQAICWTCHAASTVVVDDPTTVTGKRIVAECGTEADARLIAAAPELLEAVRIAIGNVRSLGPAGALAQVHQPYAAWLQMLEAAYAKAAGGAA